LAAGGMGIAGGMAVLGGIAYYPRLNLLLGESVDAGRPPLFDRIIDLWRDLESWSREDKREALGCFTARVRGSWRHVGLPFPQTLLAARERNCLPQFFAENDFDPTSPPAVEVLSDTLQNFNLFQARTRKILSEKDGENTYLRNSLLEIVQEELQILDGIVPILENYINHPPQYAHAMLKICIEYEAILQKLKTTVRFKSNYQFPDEGFHF
jgi:hypothetical protein